MKLRRTQKLACSAGMLLALATGCGDRADVYDASIDGVATFGLERHVAILDRGANRVVLLQAHDGQELDRVALPVGKNPLSAQSSTDGKRLFVLSAGDTVRKKGSTEAASLTVIDTANGAPVARRYELSSPHSGIDLDAEGRWVALFASPLAGTTNFVENPNEIVLIDLAAPVAEAVTSRTLRSFGALPQRVSFTPTLLLPGGPRRLLVVETDQDVALLDLDHLRSTPQRPEITVRLTSGSSTTTNRPAGVVFDDGDPARNDDARIAVRLSNAPSVVTLTLVTNTPDAAAEDPAQAPNDFRPLVNLTDVGGIAEDAVFVQTPAGRRLAAIVPTAQRAVLIDADTSVTTPVDLPSAFARISVITSVVGGEGGTDTALLYGGPGGSAGPSGVAFWSLGRTEGQPYRSVEVVPLPVGVLRALDVPPPRPELKVLQTSGGNAFYVLNLATRTASPLIASGSAALHVSPDGERLWAYQPGSTRLASIELSNLHPVQLEIEQIPSAVFDVARRDGGRALVAVDTRGSVGATVLDAQAPDVAASRSFYGLLLEGLR